jgi:hypothetical protein
MYLFNNSNLQKEQQMKKLVSLSMLVLLLGTSAATVIPKTSAPTTVAQTTQLNDEQLGGVSGGEPVVCECGIRWIIRYGGFPTPVYLCQDENGSPCLVPRY